MVGSNMEGLHVIDVNELVTSMTSWQQLDNPKAKCMCDNQSDFPLIYRMNHQICDKSERTYEPNVLSIGPYHHTTEAKQEIEHMKWMSLSYLLELNPKKQIRDYIKEMEGQEQKIRSCYASEIKMSSYDLLKMMLLDGCCIILILRGMAGIMQSLDLIEAEPEQKIHESVSHIEFDPGKESLDGDGNQDETLYIMHWYSKIFSRDLLLLENQIPFFIVMKIYELFTNGISPTSLLTDNIANSLEDLIHSYPKAIPKSERPKEFHHLLHLCHMYFKPKQTQTKNNEDHARPQASYHPKNSRSTSYCDEIVGTSIVPKQLFGWRQATEYQRAGIEIKKKVFDVDNPHSLLDIRFCDGVMEMPCLTIDPNTYCLFRNLVVFEQTCPQFGNYMTTYVIFLSQFIAAPEDVSLLTARGILIHQLNSDADVCHLFRMLCTGITFDINGDYFLKDLCRAMEMYYQIQRPKWRDWLGSIASKLQRWSREYKSDEIPNTFLPEQTV